MSIIELDGREQLPSTFLELPALIYKDDPHWIPEDALGVIAEFRNEANYASGNLARTFCIPGKVRAAAFYYPALRVDGERVVFAGFFESSGDEDANVDVFRRIESWARDLGAPVIYGPIQWNTQRGYRLRLSAEPGAIPFLGEPYNPDTYPKYWQTLGFKIARRYVTQLLPMQQVHQALMMAHPLRESLLAEGYRFEVPTPDSWVKHLPQIYEMSDAIFAQNFAYSKLSYPIFASMFAPAVMRKICQLSSVLAFAPDGTPAAFALSYPFYGPIVVQGRGAARVAMKDLDYLTHRSMLAELPPRGCIGKTLGVHPAHRRKGLKEAMLLLGFERGLPAYDFWMAALIREDNNASYRVFSQFATGERWYGLYAKRLEAAP